MFEQLVNIYRNIVGNDEVELTPKTKVSDLMLSSLGLIQLVCAIEDEYDIEITNSEMKSFKTIQDVVRVVEKKLK
ncbi:MAG: acyl carrier protein [Clostridia bacterium]|nr:acyl carrier protein [Clostridia bacterium]